VGAAFFHHGRTWQNNNTSNWQTPGVGGGDFMSIIEGTKGTCLYRMSRSTLLPQFSPFYYHAVRRRTMGIQTTNI
jgi:hypothetical protein